MDEVIPKERFKKFQNPKRENLIAVGQERLLSLRKKKIDQYINDKRMLSFNPLTKYEILLEDIPLSEEIKQNMLKEFSEKVKLMCN